MNRFCDICGCEICFDFQIGKQETIVNKINGKKLKTNRTYCADCMGLRDIEEKFSPYEQFKMISDPTNWDEE